MSEKLNQGFIGIGRYVRSLVLLTMLGLTDSYQLKRRSRQEPDLSPPKSSKFHAARSRCMCLEELEITGEE